MIQGSINQLLSMAAIGAHLSPDVQRRAEARQTKKQMSVVEKELSQMKVTPEDLENQTVTGKIAQETLEKQADLSKKLFEQTPSSKTYRQYVLNRAGTGKEPSMVFKADPAEIAQERAELEAETAQRLRQEQIQKFRQSVEFARSPADLRAEKEELSRRESNVEH